MATALEAAVDALSDPGVALPDALRRLLVVSRRINAADLTAWILGELYGYQVGEDVPAYRDGEGMSIRLRFDGFYGSAQTMTVHQSDLPDSLGSFMNGAKFRQPVAELQELAEGDSDPGVQLPMWWISEYRRLANENKAPHIEMMGLNRATTSMPRTHLKGMLDRVKSTALDLALSLEDISPEVGTTGGPTVSDEPRIEQQVHLHLAPMYANGSTISVSENTIVTSRDNATVSIGSNTNIASGRDSKAIRIDAGDIGSLLRAAGDYLSSEGVEALDSALRSDGGEAATETRGFLDRVKAGSIGLVSGMTTNAAYDGLISLIQQPFPGFLA